MRARYDVVVVGAGPAGGAAAYHLAARGLDVLLVDRKQFPRSKVCGDGLSPRALRALGRMGLGDVADSHVRIEGVRVVGRSGVQVLPYGDAPLPFTFGAVVPRIVLDDRIRRAALAAGTSFCGGAAVVGVDRDRSGRVRGVVVDHPAGRRCVAARVTLLADGASGSLSRRLARPRRLARDEIGFAARRYVGGVEGLEPYFEVRLPLAWRGHLLLGYTWVFPLRGTMANVGIGFFGRPAGLERLSIVQMLDDVLAELRAKDARFARARLVGAAEGGRLGTGMYDPSTTPPGVLLLGDAAGLTNPFTGEGIAYALESGERAAHAVAASLRGRRGGVQAAYHRASVAAHPRHWAQARVRRHARWLLSSAVPVRNGERSAVAQAVREVILDHGASAPSLAPVLPMEPVAQSLLAAMRAAIGERMRAIDPLLADVAARLAERPDCAIVAPIVAAAAVAGPRVARSVRLRQSMLCISLFGLAHFVLEQVEEGAERDTHAGNAAAVVLGDCLTAEAAAVLAVLPARVHASIAAAFVAVARAQLRGTAGHPPVPSLDGWHAALAEPAACAAAIASAARGEVAATRRDAAQFGRWIGETVLALAAWRRQPGPETAARLRAIVERSNPAADLRPSLRALVTRLRATAREVVAHAVGARRGRVMP